MVSGSGKWKEACNILKIGCARVEERERLGKVGEHAHKRDDHVRRVEVESGRKHAMF
jgi:hypothetical protein